MLLLFILKLNKQQKEQTVFTVCSIMHEQEYFSFDLFLKILFYASHIIGKLIFVREAKITLKKWLKIHLYVLFLTGGELSYVKNYLKKS